MLEVSRRTNSIDISLSATLENIDRADEETKRFLWRMGLETETFAIRLAVREGLLNALQHGSSGDPNKIIRHGLRLEDKFLIIEIEDEGSGFDWSAYMGKKAALTSGSGRGLAIMRNYCTDIEYNAKGNRLFLRKEIGERKVPANRIRKQGNVIVIKPGQDVVASMAEAFRNEVGPLLKDCPDVVVIDLTGVEMVDSSGLSALIDVRYCVNNSSSKLIVINASEDVCGVFKAIGLDRIFTVVRA